MARSICVLMLGMASLVGCASGGAADEGWSTSEVKSELVLTTVTPELVVGSYSRQSTSVTFEARKKGDSRSLLLKASDGRVLLSTAGVRETRVVSLLDNRVTVSPRIQETGLPDALEKLGDEDAFAELLTSPEAQILPWLSRALGERGITGVSHPASLDLHTFGALVARTNEVEVPTIEPAAIPGNEERAAQSSCRRATANNCYGMCGKGCGCWSWICGDCCYHGGCAAHDNDCRSCSKSNPWACTRCASFSSFWSGGGC